MMHFLRNTLRGFRRHDGGAAAVEAAFVLPILITMFFCMVELSAALDARRAVQNASFSLVQTAAAQNIVDAAARDRMLRGHDIALANASVTNTRAALYSLVRQRDGSYALDWSWNLTGQAPNVTTAQIQASFASSIQAREGILVAVIDANYRPWIPGLPTQGIRFQGVFSQVPLRKTMALYR